MRALAVKRTAGVAIPAQGLIARWATPLDEPSPKRHTTLAECYSLRTSAAVDMVNGEKSLVRLATAAASDAVSGKKYALDFCFVGQVIASGGAWPRARLFGRYGGARFAPRIAAVLGTGMPVKPCFRFCLTAMNTSLHEIILPRGAKKVSKGVDKKVHGLAAVERLVKKREGLQAELVAAIRGE